MKVLVAAILLATAPPAPMEEPSPSSIRPMRAPQPQLAGPFTAAHAGDIATGKASADLHFLDGELRVTVTRDGSHREFAPKDLAAYYGAVRRRFTKKVYRSAGHAVTHDYGRLSTAQRTLFDVAPADLECKKRSEVSHDDCGTSTRLTVLSFVGGVLSFDRTTAIHEAESPASITERIESVHAATGEPVSLAGLVDEASLVEAIKLDQWVRDGMTRTERIPGARAGQLAEAKTLDDLEGLLRARGLFDDTPEGLDVRFAVLGYDEKADLIHLRLGLGGRSEGGSWVMVQLGVKAKPRDEFRKSVRAAAAGDGFFMKVSDLD